MPRVARRLAHVVAALIALAVASSAGCQNPPALAPTAELARPSAAPVAPAAASHRFDVRDFGADASGKQKSTDAIRQAIAAAAERGGGTVVFPAGRYLTGPIHFKSHITLLIEAGALLGFSADFDDYLPMVPMRWEGTEVVNFSPLFYADGVENIAIVGRGTIDGNGGPWWEFHRKLRKDFEQTGVQKTDSKWQREFARVNPKLELPNDPERVKSHFLRPPLIQFLNSKDIRIEGVTIRNSPFWTVNPVYCDNLTITGVTIQNPDEAPNTDGINPESCRNVHISDCHIDVGDDCITIKSGRDDQARRINRPAENYTITNCTMLRGHGGVVVGSEMSAGVRRVTISNSVFEGTDRGIRLKSTRGRGGTVEEIRVSNVVMRDIKKEAITLNLFYQNTPPEPATERTPRFRNIHFDGITGHAAQAALLLGLPESPLENISFSNLNLSADKGIELRDARDVRFQSVRVDTKSGPALSVQDGELIDVAGFSTIAPHPNTPVIELGNVKRAYVHDCFAAPGTDLFVHALGPRTEAVTIEGNNLLAAKTPFKIGKEPPKPINTADTGGGPRSARAAAAAPR